MKTIRTRLGFEAVEFGEGDDKVTVGRTPLTVSNARADELTEACALVGVDVVVADAGDDDPAESDPGSGPALTATVDLSAGVAAVAGQGEPVTSETVNPPPGEADDKTPPVTPAKKTVAARGGAGNGS